MSATIKTGIIGAAGYTGGELIRLLLLHPYAELAFVQSRSAAGQPVSDVHQDLSGDTDLHFTATPALKDAEIIFLCLPHGESRQWMNANVIPEHTRVIDLGQDFRLKKNNAGFVYGLPELNREKIGRAKHIANPGCFATAIQLALLPFAEKGLLREAIHVSATTGSTGAGQSPAPATHFSRRYGNHSAYNVLSHRHLDEIRESVTGLDSVNTGDIHFIPARGAFTRGIHAVVHFPHVKGVTVKQTLVEYYATHPFVHVCDFPPDVKQVVNTNKCLLHVEETGGRAVITSVIDNLLKGASGQAVQNMNLLCGIDETSGLKLKPVAY